MNQDFIGQINPPPYGFTSLDQAINTLVPALFVFAALAAFFYMMYAALRFLASGGSDEGVKAARTIFKNVIIGLFLLAMAFVFFRFLTVLIPGMGQFFSS
jgi:hypothetical protein